MRIDTVADLLAAYERGERDFTAVRIEHAELRGSRLTSASFDEAFLPSADLDGSDLAGAVFFACDLTQASLGRADLYQSRFDMSDLSGAWLAQGNLAETTLFSVTLAEADLTSCDLSGAHLVRADLHGATLGGVFLGNTTISDTDLSAFCDASGVRHWSPSFVDFRSVLRSYRHPGLRQFLEDCGVPPMVADYTIDAAKAEGEGALESLMRSTFISYGAPDEAFARRLYEALRAKHVTTFFFPETARPGRRIGDEVHSRIQEHDRVILVCSRDSLDRPGVRNEIQETFDREARDGGAAYLIPVMLDDYLLNGWDDPLAERVRGRVAADFRGAADDERVFDKEMERLLAVLRKTPL